MTPAFRPHRVAVVSDTVAMIATLAGFGLILNVRMRRFTN